MKLSYREYGSSTSPAIVILHGLLGSSRNWHGTAGPLSSSFHVSALDLRNHGESPHSTEHSISLMADDVLEWLDDHGHRDVAILGHSMGGKVAMHVACRWPHRIRSLMVVDIAPKDYPSGSREIDALRRIDLKALSHRRDAERRLEIEIDDQATRQFLLTNLSFDHDRGYRWKANLEALSSRLFSMRRSSLSTQDRFEGRAAFFLGARSPYVEENDHVTIERHFPKARIEILDSGHNPHIEVRDEFVSRVRSFLSES